jgi:hypothetical protein
MIAFDDDWKTLARDTPEPLIARWIESARTVEPPASHPDLIVLTWEFGPPDGPHTLPDPETYASMRDFENAASNLVEADGLAKLVAVVTHEGAGTWYIYTRDKEACDERLSALTSSLIAECAVFQMSCTDRSWSKVRDALAAVLGPSISQMEA